MALALRRGPVPAVVDRHEGLTRLEVDGNACVAYPRLTGPVAVGDDVLVNVQARELGLGSGGFDVLHANLTRGLDLPPEPRAHVMALPYTPLQVALRHAEETDELAERLAPLPVVCCSLHSPLAPVCAGLGPGLHVAYVQVAGGGPAGGGGGGSGEAGGGARARPCRWSTGAAGATTTPGSSRRPSPPAASRGIASKRGLLRCGAGCR